MLDISPVLTHIAGSGIGDNGVGLLYRGQFIGMIPSLIHVCLTHIYVFLMEFEFLTNEVYTSITFAGKFEDFCTAMLMHHTDV